MCNVQPTLFSAVSSISCTAERLSACISLLFAYDRLVTDDRQ
jgi:hypothetical protein